MKKIIFLLALFVSVITTTYAQTDMSQVTDQAMKGGMGVGDALTQLGKGINPSAFGAKWPKTSADWFSNAGKVADVTGASKSLGSLVSNLKPEAFSPEFLKSKDSWAKKLTQSKSMSDIGGSMKSLVGGLNTSALTKSFAGNKDTFMKGLDMLK